MLLPSTTGTPVDLASASQGRFVLFAYPKTGRPSEPALEGWDEIPGARGCTPQSCGFRDLHLEFRALGYEVYGVSAQETVDQREFAERMRIPFAILSDAEGKLRATWNLPTFVYSGERLLKRLALVVEHGRVVKVFYPVFPPDRNAGEVLAWIRARESPSPSLSS